MCHFLPFATKAGKFRGANRHRTAITDKEGEMVNFYELCHSSERELAALCVHCRDRGGLSGQRPPHFDELISCNGGLRERGRSACLNSVCFGRERGMGRCLTRVKKGGYLWSRGQGGKSGASCGHCSEIVRCVSTASPWMFCMFFLNPLNRGFLECFFQNSKSVF